MAQARTVRQAGEGRTARPTTAAHPATARSATARSAHQAATAVASKPHETFRAFLQDGQYRITGERFEVLDAVLAWDDHFDADHLFIYLKQHGSKVSRATVYKTLNLLHECGLVSRYRFSQGHAQYEKTTDRPHHDHMVCTKCGAVIEFENSGIERLQDDACALHGFTPTYHSFQIFGICLDCRTFASQGRSAASGHREAPPRTPASSGPTTTIGAPGVLGTPGSRGVLPLERTTTRGAKPASRKKPL